MRSALLFHIYSGDVVFTAGLLLTLAVVTDLVLSADQDERLRRIARILFLLSVPLGVFGTVPVPLWIAVPFLLAWLTHAALAFRGLPRRQVTISAVILLLLTAAMIAPEIAWRLHRPPSTPPSSLFVFGDSLSSGGFGETRTWVDLIAESRSVQVTNLSRPSDTTDSVLETARDALDHGACRGCGVVIELGGNEMLDGSSALAYERDLAALVTEVRARGAGTVWIMEIPPLPGRWRWPAIQRHVARESDAILIPRRVLASVLVDDDLTFDGLHPNDRGHRRLASTVRPWLGIPD